MGGRALMGKTRAQLQHKKMKCGSRILMQPVAGNHLMYLLEKIKRSGRKIIIQLSGHPLLLIRHWIKQSRRKKLQQNP